MKNIARQIKTEKTNLSIVKNGKRNKMNNKEVEDMKQHLLAIMKAIAAARQSDNIVDIY
jgi:hypothetical protein